MVRWRFKGQRPHRRVRVYVEEEYVGVRANIRACSCVYDILK